MIKNKNKKKLMLALALVFSTSFFVQQPVVYAEESTEMEMEGVDAEVQALISRIDALPPKDDLGEQYVNEVKDLTEMYQELSQADKIYVSNYDKLDDAYRYLFKKGLISVEEDVEVKEREEKTERQKKKEISDTVESQVTEYVFPMKEGEKATIMIRYTSDSNNDGVAETPDRIVLTSPSAKPYPVSNTSIEMQDGENIKAQLTWTDTFLQIDIEKAEPGVWSIETSVPVTISQQAYAGGTSEIKAEKVTPEDNKDEKNDVQTKANEEKETKEEDATDQEHENEVEEDNGSSPLIPLLLGGGVIAGILYYLKARKKPKNNAESKSKDNEVDKMSDDDILEQMKSFMKEDMGDEDDDSYAGLKGEGGFTSYSESGFDEDYNAGDTGLLAKFEETAEHYYSNNDYTDPYEDYNNNSNESNSSDEGLDDSASRLFDEL